MTEQDLFQEALLGLARAIELFKPERHTALSTYAFQWIRQALGRSRVNTDRFIRLPAHCQRERGLSAGEYHRLTSILSFSELDVPAESLPDLSAVDPVESAINSEITCARDHTIEAALRLLPEREAHVLKRRFGLNGTPEETLNEIGKQLGLTRERVRQIEARALELLSDGAPRKILEPVSPV